MSKETFKSFARLHPELGNYVMNNNASWQKLYELYEIYGDSSSIWNNYFQKDIATATSKISETPIHDLFNTIKKIDLDSVQKGVTNLQKTIGMLQDIDVGSTKSASTPPYESRPMYKYFED